MQMAYTLRRWPLFTLIVMLILLTLAAPLAVTAKSAPAQTGRLVYAQYERGNRDHFRGYRHDHFRGYGPRYRGYGRHFRGYSPQYRGYRHHHGMRMGY